MNKYLESAVKRYKKEKGVRINPISELDAKIINQLTIILDTLNIKEVKDVLDNYKYLSDQDTLSLLTEWNQNHSKEKKKKKDSKDDPEGVKIFDNKRKFIDFDQDILEIWAIQKVNVDEYYNYNKSCMEYRIIINKDVERNPHADQVYTYNTAKLRDKKLRILKQNLSNEIEIIG